MSRSQSDNPRKVVFVTPRAEGESLRGAQAVGQLDGVNVLGITEQLPEPRAADVFCELAVVDDTHDSQRLIEAVRKFVSRWGAIERIVAVHEIVAGTRGSSVGSPETTGHERIDCPPCTRQIKLQRSPAASRNRDGPRPDRRRCGRRQELWRLGSDSR